MNNDDGKKKKKFSFVKVFVSLIIQFPVKKNCIVKRNVVILLKRAELFVCGGVEKNRHFLMHDETSSLFSGKVTVALLNVGSNVAYEV